jgi:spermidine synthase
MRFPLIAGAMSRRFPQKSDRLIALAYFSNSLGASAGALLGAFVLIGAVGLPGTVMSAGLVNIALAVVVWFVANDDAWSSPPDRAKQSPAPSHLAVGVGALLCVSALTGAASFMYEIAWIRMLSLVLGSTTHSFELMLSGFILGLAIGAMWFRSRLEQMQNPVRFLGYVQAAMAVLALLSLFAYDQAFFMMSQLLNVLERTTTGYIWFLLASHGIALLVMFRLQFALE